MDTKEKEKFSTTVYPRLLKGLRSLAGKAGRLLLSIIESRLEKRHLRKPRRFGYKPFSQEVAGLEKEIGASTEIMKKHLHGFDDLPNL